jgi:hypothetical protein
LNFVQIKLLDRLAEGSVSYINQSARGLLSETAVVPRLARLVDVADLKYEIFREKALRAFSLKISYLD